MGNQDNSQPRDQKGAGDGAGNSAGASAPGNKGSENSDPKTVTQKELDAKLSDQQSKIRTKEVQPLRDEIAQLKTDAAVLQGQIEDVEILKETIAKLHTELEEGSPEDAKEAIAKYTKALATLTEKEKRLDSKYKPEIKELSELRKDKIAVLAKEISPTFGVPVEDLIKASEGANSYSEAVKNVRAYAAENYDAAKVKAPNAGSSTQEGSKPANPEPDIKSGGVQMKETEEQFLRKMYTNSPGMPGMPK